MPVFQRPFFKGSDLCHSFPFQHCWVDCFVVIYSVMFHKWSLFPPTLKNWVLASWECHKLFTGAFSWDTTESEGFECVFFLLAFFNSEFSMNYSTLYLSLNNVLWNTPNKVLWQTAVCSFVYSGCQLCFCRLLVNLLDETKKLESLRAVWFERKWKLLYFVFRSKVSNIGEI